MAKHFLSKLNITFVDLNKEVLDAFKKVFLECDEPERYKGLKVENKDIKRCDQHDCIVSPANSFGLMDGGIDADLSKILSKPWDNDYVGREVRKIIAENYYGEQPVGTCILMETDNDNYPFLAHAPTMRFPKPVPQTLNVYYAFKAVLQEIVNHNKTAKKEKKIGSILTTVFCTGCGKIPIEDALRQMKMAYDVVHDGVDPSWSGAIKLCHYLEKLEDEAIDEKSKTAKSHSNKPSISPFNDE